MKRFFILLFAIFFCFSLIAPAFAVESFAEAEGSAEVKGSADEPLRVEVTLVSDSSSGVVPYVAGEEIVVGAEVLDLILLALNGIEANTQDDVSVHVPASSASANLILPSENDRSGLAGAMASIFGEYTPLTYQVDTYVDDVLIASGTEVVPGLAGMDWPWIFGVSLFGVMLFSFFKILGGVWR